MKAIVFDRYGAPDVLALRDIEKPAVKDNEVLVRIVAGGANPADWRMMRGHPYLLRLAWGLRRPRTVTVLGSDMAGLVEAVGKDVTGFRPGDEVYAEVDLGGFAEYISFREDRLALKPANLSFEQAAAVPMTGLTALQGLRDPGRIQAGQGVLINGASGGIGTMAVQLAKAFGADVTGVCSTVNVGLVRSIGADRVIDYTREDFTRAAPRYDLILDTVGNHSLAAFRRALVPRGTLVITGGGGGRWLGPAAQVLSAVMSSPFVRERLVPVYGRPGGDDLNVLKGIIEAGKVTPVIDRTYPLDDVPEAIGYLERRHARGKVVIAV
jgi:NADPH:quinone reductase-like Zn-dependent oxidoreductase